MPALGEDWMIEAEDYAKETYGKSLDELGFDFQDGEQFFYCHEVIVDGLASKFLNHEQQLLHWWRSTDEEYQNGR